MTPDDYLRLRVQFTKQGRLRFLSHAEYSRALMMGVRRSGIPFASTGRHRARMKISLSPPLPIGITSGCELVDLFLEAYISPEEARRLLGESLPSGIGVARCRLMGQGAKSVGKLVDTASYRAVLPEGSGPGFWEKPVDSFLQRDSICVERVQPRRTRTVDLRPGVHLLKVVSGDGERPVLEMMVDDGTRGTIKPREVLRVIEQMAAVDEGLLGSVMLHRTGLYTMRGDRFISPMDLRRGTATAR